MTEFSKSDPETVTVAKLVSYPDLLDGFKNQLQVKTVNPNVLEYPPGRAQLALAIGSILGGLINTKPELNGLRVVTINRTTPGIVEPGAANVFFSNVLHPAQVDVGTSIAIAAVNTVLEQVESPMRLPTQ